MQETTTSLDVHKKSTTSKACQQGDCYEPVPRLSAQSAILIDVLLRDGHFAADAEGAAGDF
jgi:hypothetical protein